jgi:hypothetical protein
MESRVEAQMLIDTLKSELKQQFRVVDELSATFNECNIQLKRRDQVVCLQTLKSKIMREILDIKEMESAAQMGSAGFAFLNAGTKFTFETLFLTAMGRRDAPRLAAKSAISKLGKTGPFGKVLVAIAKEGLPEDLKIIPVSRFARESKRTESEVEASWQHDGYLLMTPDQFTYLVDRVEQAVLDGSLCLPIGVNSLSLLIKLSKFG